MLRIEHSEDASGPNESESRIELLSNLSLTFDRLAGVFLLLSAVTLVVALLPTLMGYWPILVIAVVHLAIVGWCFRLAWRGYWRRQALSVSDDAVRLIDVSARGTIEQSWPAAWVRIDVDRRGSDPRLFLAMHGERVEVGAFVPPEERLEAAEWLRQALMPRSGWNRSQ